MNLKELARKAISTLFLSMLCLVAFAQTATGLVKDKTGEPMIGVNVLVKGTTNGTITDFDGKFSIPDVPSNATLVVSYIGYLTKEVKSGKDLVIVLEEDIGKALGQALHHRIKNRRKIICIDGIYCESGDFVDLGEPIVSGKVIPVIVKTLIFNG